MRYRELSLDQMLADAIVQLVMRRDGVTEIEVRELMPSLVRHRLALAADSAYELPVAA